MARMQRRGTWLASDRGALTIDVRSPPRAGLDALYCSWESICIRVIRVIRGQILFLFFLAEYLETRVGAQRIPDRIEP
jgi:hypothetical protein